MSCLPWPGGPRGKRDSASRRAVLFLPEAEAPGMGPRISFGSKVSDADGCQHAGAERGRCARLLPQLRQVSGTRQILALIETHRRFADAPGRRAPTLKRFSRLGG